ncbi:hypothetical protein NPIL_228001 [Nephila pilipes]|uniref:Uncharacterized protein n=1 Tax=Nephila pilipes TaxID=299642 RepID=A0A8X6U3J8_NEPPI|nr:hypothetical protein NPIL_228001 [Nephila pilipes]
MYMVELPKNVNLDLVEDQLKTSKLCGKLGPKVLTPDHEDIRDSVLQEMLDRVTSDPSFLKRIITRGESLMFQCDLETKRQCEMAPPQTHLNQRRHQ